MPSKASIKKKNHCIHLLNTVLFFFQCGRPESEKEWKLPKLQEEKVKMKGHSGRQMLLKMDIFAYSMVCQHVQGAS